MCVYQDHTCYAVFLLVASLISKGCLGSGPVWPAGFDFQKLRTSHGPQSEFFHLGPERQIFDRFSSRSRRVCLSFSHFIKFYEANQASLWHCNFWSTPYSIFWIWPAGCKSMRFVPSRGASTGTILLPKLIHPWPCSFLLSHLLLADVQIQLCPSWLF